MILLPKQEVWYIVHTGQNGTVEFECRITCFDSDILALSALLLLRDFSYAGSQITMK